MLSDDRIDAEKQERDQHAWSLYSQESQLVVGGKFKETQFACKNGKKHIM